ncbi:MAG: alkaline phosphatase family protein [Chloroflexi bacterium]|nr:alkaline phosphatase family protein [Chloroflexota bacterium]
MKNKYKLLLILFTLVCILIPACSLQNTGQAALLSDQKYVVIVVIDACRPDYFPVSNVPNINQLAAEGVTYSNAWVGMDPNVTPPSHATIGTGAFPKRHGVMNFLWRNPKTGLAYWYTYWEDVYSGEFNNNIKKMDIASIGSLYKKKFPDARVAALSSGKFYAAASLAADDSDYIVFNNAAGVVNPEAESPNKFEVSGVKGHFAPTEIMKDPDLNRPKRSEFDGDDWVIDVALKLFNNVRPQVLMINLPETDEFGHWSLSIDAPEVMGKCVSNVDKQIGRLMEAYKKAGIYDRTVWVITADHGMTPRLHNISQKVVDEAIAKTGTRCQIPNPETLLYDPSKSAEAVENVVTAGIPGIKGGYYRVKQADGSYIYVPTPTTAKQITGDLEKCFLYLESTHACERSADFTLIESENWRQDWSLLGAKPMISSHETITWNDQHIPLIIAGPGIKKGVKLDSPARLVDIAPTVLTLVGVTPEKMDGVVLADCAEEATQQQIEAQNAISQYLQPLAAALKASSQADLADNALQFGKQEQ